MTLLPVFPASGVWSTAERMPYGHTGGSAKEMFAVYSIVNSLALNIPEIRRVGILIEGEAVDTLNGHMDLRRPLRPDSSMIVGSNKPVVAGLERREPSHVG